MAWIGFGLAVVVVVAILWSAKRSEQVASDQEVSGLRSPVSNWEELAERLGLSHRAAGMPFPAGHAFWDTGLFRNVEGGFRDIVVGQHEGTAVVIFTLPRQASGAARSETFVVLPCSKGIPIFELQHLGPGTYTFGNSSGIPPGLELHAESREEAMKFLTPILERFASLPNKPRLRVYPPWATYSEGYFQPGDERGLLLRAESARQLLG